MYNSYNIINYKSEKYNATRTKYKKKRQASVQTLYFLSFSKNKGIYDML